MSMFHSRTELIALGREECMKLLGSRHVGRVAFVIDGQPMVMPVNYGIDEATIVFRTDQGAKLSNLPLAGVAFEVDEIDEATGEGWDVVVQGHADEITDTVDKRSEFLRSLPVETFAPGMKAHWIRIVPKVLSGRRILAR
jgi:nitroimidazol reductase NimA-like FMN-containing flavoprotein (pyridoxamine 5'-phosphate oxidase superfamily)